MSNEKLELKKYTGKIDSIFRDKVILKRKGVREIPLTYKQQPRGLERGMEIEATYTPGRKNILHNYRVLG